VLRAVSIRKRVWGPANRRRKAWVLDYYDQAGKRRRKGFKQKRDAEAFAATKRILSEGRAFVDDDQLNYTIHQERLYGQTAEPLPVRAIIHLIGKALRSIKPLSDAEATFLNDFAAASDRGTFIEDRFLNAAVEGGNTLKSYTCRAANADEAEDAGWVGLHRFFGMYVVNCTQYGEGQDEYGPFAKQKDAKAVFDAALAFNT